MRETHRQHHFKVRRNRTGERKNRGANDGNQQYWLAAIAVRQRTIDQCANAGAGQKDRNNILDLVGIGNLQPLRHGGKGGQHCINGQCVKRHQRCHHDGQFARADGFFCRSWGGHFAAMG